MASGCTQRYQEPLFSFAMELMDKVEGWNEEKWVGSNFVACLWIYTKAVLCDGRRRYLPLDLEFILGTIVKSVTWVSEGSLWEHEWITDTNVTLKENEILEALDYESTCLVHCSGVVTVLSTDEPQSQVRGQWTKSSKIQRHSQQCD